jgi:hypothetical protein
MKNFLVLLVAVCIGLSSCRKDSLSTNTTTTSPIPKEYVKAQVYGVVIDEYEQTIANADVSIVTQTGTEILKTDKNGVFLFPTSTLNAKGTYVKVNHPAFFHGSKVINLLPNSRNNVVIQLLSNTATKNISASTGGKADYGDFSIELPANGVVTASGQPYNGQVQVAAHYLKPSETGFSRLAPGRLEGLTIGGDVTGLVSLGQMAVELRGTNGELLQLKSGSEATLRIQVPSASLSLAPSSIPMWWFDEQAGIWKEEGNSTLTNGWYEGKVKHFTFWNWDFISPSVSIDFKFVDANGDPVTNVFIDVQATVQHTHGSGTPDANGHLIGNVPANEPLIANVYAQGVNCSSILLFTQAIGPFSAPAQVCLTVNPVSIIDEYTLTGTLLDCNGLPVTSGYVRTSNTWEVAPVDANGQYTIRWNSCQGVPTSVTIFGFDFLALKESDPVVVPITGSTVTVPPITVCQTLSSYFTLNTSNGTYNYIDAQVSKDSSGTGNLYYVNAYNQSNPQQPNVSFSINVNNGLTNYEPGTFQVWALLGGSTNGHGCDANCTGMVVTITENGGSGGFLAGTFTGTLPNQFGTPAFTNAISGSFRIRIF